MTEGDGPDPCRVQRLALPDGTVTWTVLGADLAVVGQAEEFLEFLRVQASSPNTVKSYARALALWWQYLQVFGLAWDWVTLESVGGFLTWLRTGDGPRVVSIERRAARFAESTIAALQAVVSARTDTIARTTEASRMRGNPGNLRKAAASKAPRPEPAPRPGSSR